MKKTAIRVPLLAGAIAGALVAGAPAASAAALGLSQADGVTAGQTITFSLSGLPADLTAVAVGQCKARVSGPADCNLGGSLLGSSDGQGVWQPNGGASITLVASVGGVDCTAAAGACIIGVTSLSNPTQILAATPLSFG